MLVNTTKTKALVISRSKTAPIFPELLLEGTVIEKVAELKVLGHPNCFLCCLFNTKLSFKNHIRSIAASTSSKLGITTKALFVLMIQF